MSIVKTGDVIIWRVEVEPEETLQQICLNIQNQNPGSGVTEYCWSRGVTVDNPVPQTQRFQDALNQVRLMDVDRLYKEIYISEGWTFRSIGQSMGAPSTMQEKHAFLNWRTAEGDFSLDTTSTEPLTLYASYAHPLVDTWTPQADDAFHWVECTCGEKANMEVHIEGEGKVIKPPTDTDPGEKTYECMKCHHVRTEVIRSTINYSIIMNGYSDGGAPWAG